MAIDVRDLFVRGQKKLQAEGARKESTKVGTLRAGNSGMLTEDGQIIGPCMALTYLRFKGIDVKGLEDDGDSGGAAGRELMFEAGRVNEDLWTAVLEQTWDGPILREEQIATTWETSKGIRVTGRPDIVLCQSIGGRGKVVVEPQLGLELKQISSFWTAYEVLFKGQPKYPHLLQAAHYSWQLGIPFELWYTCRADYHVADWIKSQLPRPGEPNSEPLAYTYYGLKADRSRSKISKMEYEERSPNTRQADPLKVTPFIKGYKIEIRAGTLFYSSVGDNQWHKTNITVDSIVRYYETVPELTEVPPEPKVLKADGTRANYKAKDYCSMGPLCCAYQAGRNIDEWTQEVKQKLTGEAKVISLDADKSDN